MLTNLENEKEKNKRKKSFYNTVIEEGDLIIGEYLGEFPSNL